MAELSGIWVDWVNSPRIIWVEAPRVEVTIQDLIDTIRGSLEDRLDALDDPTLISTAAGKQFLGGTTYVGLTLELLNAVIAFEARTDIFDDGYVTFADDADAYGDTLIDAYATFITNGIQQGDLVYNTDDNSKCSVKFVRSETELVTTPLAGGTNNKYNLNDRYEIYDVIACEVSGGNLTAVDFDGYSIEQVFTTFGTRVKITAASSATQTEQGAIQYSSYQNAVWLDVDSSTSGTAYPAGTRQFPVNNLTDAISIANAEGFSVLQLLTSLTLDSGSDITGFTLIGKSRVLTLVVMAADALCSNVTIKNCNISGTLDGGTHIRDCLVGDLTYVNGQIYNSGLYGTLLLGGGLDAVLFDCAQVDPGIVPIIDMNSSGQDLSMADWSGEIIIKNLTSSGNKVLVQIDGGIITLDSTITAGEFKIHGIGILEDNATSYTSLSTDGLMSKQTITEVTWDTVYIDTINGIPGSDWPAGTRGTPVDNITDARTIANFYNICCYDVMGSITLNDDFSNSSFTANSPTTATIDLNNQNVDGAAFSRLGLTGQCNGSIHCHDCELDSITNLDGLFMDCGLSDGFSVNSGSKAYFFRAFSNDLAPMTFDMNGDGILIYYGTAWITVTNLTDPAGFCAFSGDIGVTVDASVTDGNIYITGDTVLDADNKTGGSVVITYKNSFKVWEEYRSAHTVPGTFGGDFSTAGTTAAELDAYLSANHGDGNWEGSGDPGAVADAVWDEERVGHTTPGTFGGDFSDAGATVEEIDAYLSTGHGAGNWEGSGDPGAVAEAVWSEILPGSFGDTTAGGRLAAITTQLTRVLGLEHENAFIDNTIHDAFGQLTTSRIRIFDSKANANNATDGGAETTGLIATYTMTAVYEAAGRMKFYRMVKE
jgi:hypothetical protein